MGGLNGKRVLITGGGSGIGMATAARLLADGAKVAITGRDAAKLARAATALGKGVVTAAADLSSPEGAAKVVAEATAALGGIDVLVCNAGVNIKERQFKELTPASWDALVKGNLDSAYHAIQAVLPAMRDRGAGYIVVVNSISGKRANPLGGVGYIAAKFGLRGLAMGVAAEEKAAGIRVTSVYPGEVNTPLLEQRPEAVSDERKATMLQPEDLAATIAFLVGMPAHVAIPELVITPANATYI